MRIPYYRNRQHAGEVLAEALLPCHGDDTLVLAVPRGGIPTAMPVVYALHSELDLIIARKITAPGQPELAVGAVCEDHEILLNPHLVQQFNLSDDNIHVLADREVAEIKRRLTVYRGERTAAIITGRKVIVIDDGVATGFTITAALHSIRRNKPSELILAIPVAPPETVELLAREVDRVVCPLQPVNFAAVGQFYENFDQLTDEDVMNYLKSIWCK